MKKVALLSRGGVDRFRDIGGSDLFADLPCELIIFHNETRLYASSGYSRNPNVRMIAWKSTSELKEKVREQHLHVVFNSIITIDELLVEVACGLRRSLNVEHGNADDVALLRNKILMKEAVGRAGLRVPQYVSCVDAEKVYGLIRKFGKIVIKPVSGTASIGVSIISAVHELDAWFERHSSPIRYQAEEFIDGQLFHVNNFMKHGRSIGAVSASYSEGYSDVNFSDGTSLRSRVLQPGGLSERLSTFGFLVAKSLNFHDGVSHTECFVTHAGEIIFCEMAGRPGGGIVPWLVEAQTGINPIVAAVLLSVGIRPTVTAEVVIPENSVASAIGFRIGGGKGVVAGVAQVPQPKIDWLKSFQVFFPPGAPVSPTLYSTEFVGQAIFESATTDEFDKRCIILESLFEKSMSRLVS